MLIDWYLGQALSLSRYHTELASGGHLFANWNKVKGELARLTKLGKQLEFIFLFFEVSTIPDFEHNVAFELINPIKVMLQGNE